jgi:tellurium resistance protein TerD
MAINLKKGASFNLTKEEPGLKKILIGLGWDLQSNPLDIDVSALMLSAKGKLLDEPYFIFYNNLRSPDGSVQHMGDNRTGKGDGDDEIVLANLDLVHPEVTEISFLSTLHDAAKRRHHFGMLSNAYIRIMDVQTEREILRYNLGSEFVNMTEVEFGRLQKISNEWRFLASGHGTASGLETILNNYL